MNKYEKWYKNITDSAQNRITNEYTETHHILPKSLGGSDEFTNLIQLTAREHFVCHWLLTKIYATGEEHWKMVNAFRMMRSENPRQKRYTTKITARVYANLKEKYSVLQSERYKGTGNGFYGKKHSEEVKNRISEANKGDKNAAKRPETRKKISESKIGKKRESFDDTWRLNLSKASAGENNGMYGKTHSDETKQKQRERAIGRKQSDETKQKKADAIRGLKREKKLCPHCQKLVAVNGYARWHGDNCKMI